jgi:hypothetical protein
LVDLDGDGINDLISGSWPGEIFFFKGRGGGKFDAPVKLKDKNGKTINIGGGIERNDDNEFLIAGDATFDNKDGKNFIVYEGERYDVTGKQGGITGTASAVFAADLNGDGRLDLIVGDVQGNVWFVPNEGTPKAWAFGAAQHLRAGGEDIKVEGDAGPTIADWDGDGKPDLILGSGDGSVRFYRNTGEVDPQTKLPVLAAPRVLVPASAQNGAGEASATTPECGIRTKVCVADWNGDGKPDLLVGDFSTLKPDLPQPTPEKQAEYDKLREQMNALQPRYQRAISKLYSPGSAPKLDAKEREAATKDFVEVSRQMEEIRQKLPQEREYHGWVWVFLRK